MENIVTKILTLLLAGSVLLNAALYSAPKHETLVGAQTMVGVPQGGTGFSSTSPNSLIVGGSTATGRLTATSSPTIGYFTATSTIATSTVANGIQLLGGCILYQGSCLSSTASEFTFSQNYGAINAATSSALWAQGALNASSTLRVDGLTTLTYASATTMSLTGSVLVGGNATTTGSNGNIATEGTLSAKGAITFSGLSNGAVSVSSGLLSGGTLSVANGGTASTTLGGLLVGAGSSINSTSTVSANNGGTGNSVYAVGDLLYASATNVLTRLAISATAGQVLTVSGGLPVWAATSTSASSTLLSDFNNWTNKQSLRTATALILPRTASSTGSIALADGQLAIVTGNGQTGYITATSSLAWNISSSTLDAMGKKFSVGTSSFLLRNDPEPLTMLGFYCTASTTGTANVSFSDGVNETEIAVCTTGGYTKTVTNNTWTAYEPLVLNASSTKGDTSRITVTAVLNKTQN